jgi:hypothetical protein
MKAYGGVDVHIHIFLTPPLVGGEWSASHPGRFTPRTHWLGGWVGPRPGLNDTKKILDPHRDSNSDPSVVKNVASRYTDYAIPAPEYRMKTCYIYDSNSAQFLKTGWMVLMLISLLDSLML